MEGIRRKPRFFPIRVLVFAKQTRARKHVAGSRLVIRNCKLIEISHDHMRQMPKSLFRFALDAEMDDHR